jgi:hypothetical protein
MLPMGSVGSVIGVSYAPGVTGRLGKLAPAVGFEPTTWRLTAARSTTELRRNEAAVVPAAMRPSRPRRAV